MSAAALQDVQNSQAYLQTPTTHSVRQELCICNMEPLSWAGGGRWMLKMSSRRDPVLLQVGISCRGGCAPICTCTPSPEMRCSQTKLGGVWGFCACGPLTRRAAWPGRAPGGRSCLPAMFLWFVGMSQKTGLPAYARWRAADPGPVCQTGRNGFVLSFVWLDHQRSFTCSRLFLFSLSSTVISFQIFPGSFEWESRPYFHSYSHSHSYSKI